MAGSSTTDLATKGCNHCRLEYQLHCPSPASSMYSDMSAVLSAAHSVRSLGSNGITSKGAHALFKAVSENAVITDIEFDGSNQFHSCILMWCASLQGNALNSEGALEIAASLASLKHLKRLSCVNLGSISSIIIVNIFHQAQRQPHGQQRCCRHRTCHDCVPVLRIPQVRHTHDAALKSND